MQQYTLDREGRRSGRNSGDLLCISFITLGDDIIKAMQDQKYGLGHFPLYKKNKITNIVKI